MNVFKYLWLKFYDNYNKSPGHFWGWFISMLIFGLLGLHAPVAYKAVKEIPIDYGNIIISGSLSTFCIVTLIDNVLNIFSMPASKRKGNASFWLVVSIMLILFNSIFYSWSFDNSTTTLKYIILLVGIISGIISLLLYGFRIVEPEEDASVVSKEDNEEVTSPSGLSENEEFNPILKKPSNNG